MKNQVLTKRQKEILEFIKRKLNSKGFPPSIQEIRDYFGFGSPTGVNDHLNALAKKGYILRHPGVSRGIELINHGKVYPETDSSFEIPIVGCIAAGTPILAEENITGTISVDKALFRSSAGPFALRVKGDSMIDAGILNGDYAIIHPQPMVNDGEIGAVIIEGEATLKKVYIRKDRMKLVPANSTMEPIEVQLRDKNVMIAGKLKGIIRKV